MIYKIISHHYAPKDSHGAVQFFVNAEDERNLYEQVKKELYWEDQESEGGEDFIKELIELKGNDNEELTGFDDLYYGVTTFSWEECGNLSDADFGVLDKAGMTKISSWLS